MEAGCPGPLGGMLPSDQDMDVDWGCSEDNDSMSIPVNEMAAKHMSKMARKKERQREIIKRAKMLANAFLSVLKSGTLFTALAEPGHRMKKQNADWELLSKLVDDFKKRPHQ